MAAKVTITSASFVASADAARRGKEDVQIMYTVAVGDGPQPKVFQGSVLMPAETYNLQQAQAMIGKREKDRIATIGQSFTI
jgi:hypothetical protein